MTWDCILVTLPYSCETPTHVEMLQHREFHSDNLYASSSGDLLQAHLSRHHHLGSTEATHSYRYPGPADGAAIPAGARVQGQDVATTGRSRGEQPAGVSAQFPRPSMGRCSHPTWYALHSMPYDMLQSAIIPLVLACHNPHDSWCPTWPPCASLGTQSGGTHAEC